jgi:hypothetical protein
VIFGARGGGLNAVSDARISGRFRDRCHRHSTEATRRGQTIRGD